MLAHVKSPVQVSSGDRGKYTYIAIDGCDGSGKSTLQNLLLKHLSKRKMACMPIGRRSWLDTDATRKLIGTEEGRMIVSGSEYTNALIKDHLLLDKHIVRPILRSAHVIADRTFISGAIDVSLRYRVSVETIVNLYRVSRIIIPDMIIYLNADTDSLIDRITMRKKSVQPHETHLNLLRMAALYNEILGAKKPYWIPRLIELDSTSYDLNDESVSSLFQNLDLVSKTY